MTTKSQKKALSKYQKNIWRPNPVFPMEYKERLQKITKNPCEYIRQAVNEKLERDGV